MTPYQPRLLSIAAKRDTYEGVPFAAMHRFMLRVAIIMARRQARGQGDRQIGVRLPPGLTLTVCGHTRDLGNAA